MAGVAVALPAGFRQPVIEMAIMILGLATACLIVGCSRYARYYRMNEAWALLGLASIPGVMVLAIVAGFKAGSARPSLGGGFQVITADPYRKDVWRMDVYVLLDDSLGLGVFEPINMQLPRGANIKSAVFTLADAIPEIRPLIGQAAYRLNGEEVDEKEDMTDQDVLVVHMPVPEAEVAPPELPETPPTLEPSPDQKGL